MLHSKTLYPPDSLNGAESQSHAFGHAHLRLESFFANRKNWKTYFFELLLGNLSDLRETWHVNSSAGPDLKLSKEFIEFIQIMRKLLTKKFL